MKNKFGYVLLVLLFSFSFLNVVYAADYEVVISAVTSTTTVFKEEKVSIFLNVKSDKPVETCHFQVSSDSNLVFLNMNNVNAWQYNGAINNFTIENDVNVTTPLTNGENVIQLNYQINDAGSLTIKTLDCAYVSGANEEEWFSDYEIETVVVDFNIQDLSEFTTLSSLSVISGGVMEDTFDSSNKGTYFINLSSPTFGLSWTTTNPDYQNNVKIINVETSEEIVDPKNITFNGNGSEGMPLEVRVNGNDGRMTTYTLVAMYEQPKLDNTLKSVTINGKELTLIDGQFIYEDIVVSSDVSSFTVEAELNDSENFKFGDAGNAPGNFTINDIVDFNIVVESKNDSSSVVLYTFRVTKEGSSPTEPGKDGNGNSGGSSGNNNGSGRNPDTNPQTGGVSMFVMAFILVVSLIGSVVLYQKNLESYK